MMVLRLTPTPNDGTAWSALLALMHYFQFNFEIVIIHTVGLDPPYCSLQL